LHFADGFAPLRRPAPGDAPPDLMKTLHSYLMRQILTTLVMTVLVFSFVLLLGTALREVLGMLVDRQVSLYTVVEAMVLLVPYALKFALPMGALTATLLTFGRFSADQELTAVRAGGISLVALSTPVLLLGLALCGLSTIITMEVAPRCRNAFRDLLFRASMQSTLALIPERQYVKDFKGLIFFVSKVKGDTLRDVLVYTLDSHDDVENKMHAETGRLVISTNREATLLLYKVRTTALQNGKWLPGGAADSTSVALTPAANANTTRRARLSDMTFGQLLDEKRSQERRGVEVTPILTEMHSRISFAFSCFGFTLVGIPLAIRAHRRETSIGVAIALILVLVYYSLIMFGESLDTRPNCYPYLIVWLPNIVFQAIGMVLFWRADRGV
jgi:lipopolysaccharide export system permease protein